MLTYPLPLADFWDQLLIASVTLDCPPQDETSTTGGGEVLRRRLAPPTWQGSVTLGKLTPEEAAEADALLDLARQTDASFLVCHPGRRFPRMDPGGEVIGATVAAIQSIGTTRRDLRIGGLPPYYQLRRGDMIGLSWGSSPTRYGLHRLIENAAADVTGLTPLIEVTPAIHIAVSAGAPVALVNAPVKVIIMPGSIRPGTLRRGLVEGASFEFRQTYR